MLYLNYVKRIKPVEFRENVRAFFPQGQSKLSVKQGLNVFQCSLKITELADMARNRCISKPY